MAIVDKKTPRLGLLLPSADNFLQDDVERLIQSFDLLDVLVVMRDQNTGKIADDQLSEVIARLDAQGKIATSALPSSVVQKGADGKIDSSVLPSIAIIDSFPVPNEASMLGLQCERGDIAIRTDLGRSFILTDLPPSKLSNWRELTSTNVTSVNGQVWAITGLAKAGVNDDITQLTALSGPLRLGGDAVGDYDAVTMRQLRSVSGGAGGPSMNGVMNYGVGDFHLRDSRAYIQPYEVVSDGQLLNRADWPELWAYAQMLSPISDAEWLAAPSQRGKYSLGDGSTTFRVPDRNGVQVGSIPGLYGRGDGIGSTANSQADGLVFASGAPNITGHAGGVLSFGASGAFSYYGEGVSVVGADPGTNLGVQRVAFNAAGSSTVYGRYADEIMGRNFVGVWVIRASGGFVAANTSWSVKNADGSAPALNTTVRGGEVVSEYSNPTSKQFARMYSNSAWGSASAAVIEAQGTATHAYKFYEDGTVDFRQSGKTNPFRMHTPFGTWAGITDATVLNLNTNGMDRIAIGAGSDVLVRGYSIGGQRPNGYPTKVGFHMYLPGSDAFGVASVIIGGDNGKFCRYFLDIDGQIYGSTDYNNFSYAKNAFSDSRFKHSISPVGVEKSYSNIQGLEFVEFIYDNDEQERVRHGVIAQQAETVEPLYVKTRKYVGINPGEVVEQKELDTTPMLLDTMHVVQVLMQKIEAMEAEIAALKASK